MKRRDTLDRFRSDGLSGTFVYFTVDNVMSYAMARLKADHRYRSNDPRMLNHWRKKTEADLRARLTDPRNYWYEDNSKLIQPGGSWWEHTQENIAELEAKRSGDEALIAKVREENAAKSEARRSGYSRQDLSHRQRMSAAPCTGIASYVSV